MFEVAAGAEVGVGAYTNRNPTIDLRRQCNEGESNGRPIDSATKACCTISITITPGFRLIEKAQPLYEHTQEKEVKAACRN